MPNLFCRDRCGLSHEKDLIRFLGLSLGGGKTDKASLAALDYYPQQRRLFLSKVIEKIKPEDELSGDTLLVQDLLSLQSRAVSLHTDVPFRLPSCILCSLPCPGHEACQEPHIRWMWAYENDQRRKKRPRKVFTPYTQRCIDLYLQTEYDEPFQTQHALGSNAAPLLARAIFLKKRIQMPWREVPTNAAVWRLGRGMQVMKSHLRSFRKSVGGEDARHAILEAFLERQTVFIYEQDRKILIRNHHAFEAFICSFVGFLEHKEAIEPRPANWPAYEDWPSIPKEDAIAASMSGK